MVWQPVYEYRILSSQMRKFLPYYLLCKTGVHNYSIQREESREMAGNYGDPTPAGVAMFSAYVIAGTIGIIATIITIQYAVAGKPIWTPITWVLNCGLLALVTERYRRGPSDKICRICERVDLAFSKAQIRESAKDFERRKAQALEAELADKFRCVTTTWRQNIGVRADNVIVANDDPDRVLPLMDQLNPNARQVL